MLALQRQAGNAAVSALLSGRPAGHPVQRNGSDRAGAGAPPAGSAPPITYSIFVNRPPDIHQRHEGLSRQQALAVLLRHAGRLSAHVEAGAESHQRLRRIHADQAVVSWVADTLGGAEMPSLEIWAAPTASINRARLAIRRGQVREAATALASASAQWYDADRRLYRYREGTISGGERAQTTLEVVEAAGAVAATVATGGLAGGGLLAGAAVAGGTAGAYGLVHATASQASEVYNELRPSIDVAAILRTGLEEGVLGFVATFTGGQLSRRFARMFGHYLGETVSREVLLEMGRLRGLSGPLPRDFFLGRGQRFIVDALAGSLSTSVTSATRAVLRRLGLANAQPSTATLMEEIIHDVLSGGGLQILMGQLAHGRMSAHTIRGAATASESTVARRLSERAAELERRAAVAAAEAGGARLDVALGHIEREARVVAEQVRQGWMPGSRAALALLDERTRHRLAEEHAQRLQRLVRSLRNRVEHIPQPPGNVARPATRSVAEAEAAGLRITDHRAPAPGPAQAATGPGAEIATLSPEQLLAMVVRLLRRPGPMREAVVVHPTQELFEAMWRRRHPTGQLPGGWFSSRLAGLEPGVATARGHIHLPPRSSLLAMLHESLHWASERSQSARRLGTYWNEGVTEWLARFHLGSPAARQPYDRNVRFVEQLAREIGREPIVLGYLDGDWGPLEQAIARRVGSPDEGRRVFELMRRVGGEDHDSPLLEQVGRMLRLGGYAETPPRGIRRPPGGAAEAAPPGAHDRPTLPPPPGIAYPPSEYLAEP